MCNIRFTLWAASSVNFKLPSDSESNFTPFSIKSLITQSEISEIYLTTFGLFISAPAFKVSCMYSSVWSAGLLFRTPTIPPWAYLELLSPKSDFVNNKTPSGKLLFCAILRAAYNPAAPLPIITTEYSECFIIVLNWFILLF